MEFGRATTTTTVAMMRVRQSVGFIVVRTYAICVSVVRSRNYPLVRFTCLSFAFLAVYTTEIKKKIKIKKPMFRHATNEISLFGFRYTE